MEKHERIHWIDFAKGIGIILVVLGHIEFCPTGLKTFLCSFHMPLFFFLSGITFRPEKYEKLRDLLHDKFTAIVIPYTVFCTFLVAWKNIFSAGKTLIGMDHFEFAKLVKNIVGIFLNIRTTDYGSGVWFLTCIFCCYILFFIICKLSKKNSVRLFLASLSLIIGCVYIKTINIKLPWAFDASLIAVFFMFLGYVIKDKITRIEKMNKTVVLLMGGVFFIGTWLLAAYHTKLVGYDIDMWANHYGNVLLFIVTSVLGIITTVCFSIVFKQNQIEAIGKDSLYYYGIHVIFVDIIAFLVNVINTNIGLNFPCWQILVTGISVLIVCFCVKKTLPLYKNVIDRLKRIYIRTITGDE